MDALRATSPNAASLRRTIACSPPPTKISPRSLRSRALTTGRRSEQKTVTTELHFPLDTQDRTFWLRNRRRRNWNLRTEALLEGPIGDQGCSRATRSLHALLRWVCSRRALLRHWSRSRMTMLDALQRRPEFCHPEFSRGLRRGFPTIAERMKIHLTRTRNIAD
jgi:hypothetical protein